MSSALQRKADAGPGPLGRVANTHLAPAPQAPANGHLMHSPVNLPSKPPKPPPKQLEENDERLKQYSRRIVYTDNVTGLQLPEFITTSHKVLQQEHTHTIILGVGNLGYVYKFGRNLAYKQHGSDAEYQFMKDAGELSIKPYSRVLRLSEKDQIVTDGIIMELGLPVNFDKITSPEEKAAVKDELISLVTRLHTEKRIAHGDIKPLNFLRGPDGRIRLCDWDCALHLDDEMEEDEWDAGCTQRYTSPNRGFPDWGPPSVQDDMYGLAILIWEIYTGRGALRDEFKDLEKLIPLGHTVDVYAIKDKEVREWVKATLVAGGARIPKQGLLERVGEWLITIFRALTGKTTRE